MMRKGILLKSGILCLVFILSLIGFNYYYAEKKNEGASEMLKATLPVLKIRVGGYEVNQMHGYLGQINAALLRETITPVGSGQKINLELADYNYNITAIYYQIFYGADSSVLEEGVLNKLEEKDGLKTAALTLKSTLDTQEEYLAKFTIRLDSSRRVDYYSRLKYGTDLHFKESVDFAQNLSDMMIEKNDSLNRYLEPDPEVISNNLGSVNIHSSFEAVTYAQSKPERVGDVSVAVKEINADYVAVELQFLLEAKNGKGQVQACAVVENYKVRYSPNRMFLLDYNRSQEAYYNPEYLDTANNRIYLGSGSAENVTCISSEDNERACFVREHQLWYYSYQSASVTKVFSFPGEDLADRRENYDQHNIHILKMDKKGNINFVVYGYMNRGRHEGENGIALYHFDAASSTNEELAFIPSKVPYQNIKEDVSKFSYLNKEQVFFFLLDGALYQVDTKTGEWKILRDNLVDNSLTASADNGIVAIQENEDSMKNTAISLIHLDTLKEEKISSLKDERIRAVGFVLSDFVYGVADKEKVGITKSGAVQFPMYEIRIVDRTGKEIKTYSKTGQSIIKTEVSGNVVELIYGKAGRGGYRQTGSDYIRYKEEEKDGEVSVVLGYDGICYNQLYLQFPLYVYVQKVPALKVTKELVTDEMNIVNVEERGLSVAQYLVYANGTLAGTYSTAYEAIKEAEEIRGLVVNNERQTVWESNIAEYNQVIGLNMQKAGSRQDTFYACVAMVAALEGKNADIAQIKEQGKEKLEVLDAYVEGGALNLYGCSVDQILCYIGKDIPVIAGLSNGQYVLVMSYNSTKIRYMDPLSGKEVVLSRADFQNKVKQAGNEFYSYMKQ